MEHQGPNHIALRAYSSDDLDVLFAIASEFDSWEERNLSAPAPETKEEFRKRLAGHGDSSVAYPQVNLVVTYAGATAGSVSLFKIDPLARHAEAGISLLPNMRNRGIGTEAMKQLVEFGFVRLNLRRIYLRATASNLIAIASYKNAGFTVEGRQREHAWVRGRYEDVVLMGVIRSQSALSST